MSWIPAEIEYRISVLKKEIQRVADQIPVYEKGIEEESIALDLQVTYRSELVKAMNFLKKTKTAAVSLSEYKSILIDLSIINYNISQKELTIEKLNGILEEKHRELKFMKSNLHILSMTHRRGVVLPFRSKA